MREKVQWKKIWSRSAAMLVLAFALLFLADELACVSLAVSAAKVTAKGANIRKEASTTSTAVGSAAQNDKLEVLGQKVGDDGKVWYQVYVNGTNTGFIRSDLVEITDGSTPPTIGGTETTKPVGTTTGGEVEQVVPVKGKVAGSNTVRVRTSASTANSNNILTTVSSGTEVTVVGRITGDDSKLWYQIKFTNDGKEVIGYIRSDYLPLTEELKPLEEVTVDPPKEEPTEKPTETEKPAATEPNKRYETKLINEKWYILDYEVAKQFEIDQLFAAADEYKKLYEDEKSKAGSRKIWLIVLGFLVFGLAACIVYLIYRMKEYKEEAFIASIENSTVSRGRTAERPRTDNRRPAGAGDRPTIREGVSQQRPAGAQQGGRPTGAPQQGGRPAGAPQQGARPAGAPQQGGRPVGAPQQGARPAGAPQQGARPAGPQVVQGGRPAAAQARPQAPQQRPAQPDNRARSVNFMNDDDDVDFEVLNWDGDEE